MLSLLNLDLQFFSDDDFVDGESELYTAIQDLIGEDDELEDDELEDSEDDDLEDDEEYESDEEDDYEDDEESDDELDDEDVEDDEPQKKVQSKEENARFAAQRRQAEIDKRVQAELDRLKQESPEFLLAKQLSEMYGKPVNEIQAELREAALKKEAQEKNLPLELLRERQADRDKMQTLEQELNQMKYMNWQNQIKADGERLQADFPMLTQEDMDGAVNYILNVARNVDMPLEQAVYAVHGKKIVESMAKAKVQDDLAKQSGRSKKVPLSPRNGKASKTVELSAEESYIAKQFGMTAEDYISYKS